MKKVRVAQIGTSANSHGTEIFSAIAKMPEIYEIVGFAFPENEKEKFPNMISPFNGYKELTVEEVLNDPSIDAVIVETEEIYLTKYAQMVVDAGKHLHMEKPGGISLVDFEKLINTVKNKNTIFHTGYMYRYNPAIMGIIKRIREGEIGEVVCVEAQMNCRHNPEVVRWISSFPGGMMFFLGCHMIDLVLQIQGFPKKIIPFNKWTGRIEDVVSQDFSMAVFEYEKGASIIKTTSVEYGGFSRRQLVITGTKGRFVINPLEVTINYPLQYTEYNECMIDDWNTYGVNKRTENYNRYDLMMKSFAEMVLGIKKNPYSYDYELELFKTIKKCCE